MFLFSLIGVFVHFLLFLQMIENGLSGDHDRVDEFLGKSIATIHRRLVCPDGGLVWFRKGIQLHNARTIQA